MAMGAELDKAQEALGQARKVLASLDYTTERVNHIKFERSSDGVWWFRVTAERVYFQAEGVRAEDDKGVVKGREDSALSLLLRVYGDKLADFGKGIR
jgi:hypothetical protein